MKKVVNFERSRKAFTLIEILVVMAVLMIVVGFSFVNFVSFGQTANQDDGQAFVRQALRQTQSNSMANISDLPWGLRLQTDRIVIFSGTYNQSEVKNQVKLLPKDVTLSWNLTGAGEEIIFDKGKSSTANDGILTLSSITSASTTITINSEGMIE